MASSALFGRLRPAFVSKKSSTSSTRNLHLPHGAGMYRLDAPPVLYGPRIKFLQAMQVGFWFNILYSFWYQPELLCGHIEFQPPNPALWTDEELGIPPDDYDEEVEQGNAYYVRSL